MAEPGLTEYDVFRNIGKNVVALRKAKGWSQKELSEVSFIKLEELALIEAGHEDTPISRVFALSEVFSINIDDLISTNPNILQQNFAAF